MFRMLRRTRSQGPTKGALHWPENRLTEDDGHENDGPNLQDIKLQNPTTLNTVALIIHAVALK